MHKFDVSYGLRVGSFICDLMIILIITEIFYKFELSIFELFLLGLKDYYVWILGVFAYYVVCFVCFSASIGDKVVKLYILNMDEKKLHFSNSIIRSLVMILIFSPSILANILFHSIPYRTNPCYVEGYHTANTICIGVWSVVLLLITIIFCFVAHGVITMKNKKRSLIDIVSNTYTVRD